MKKVGIVGHRSWIAQPLVQRLQLLGYEVDRITKRDAAMLDTRDHVCMVIIPGKIVQSDDEMVQEFDLVRAIVNSRNACRRQILLSSSAISERPESRYGRHKFLVEQAFFYGLDDRQAVAVRPGAIFGPGQDVNAPMLIPQLMREGANIELRTPDVPTKFISVDSLAAFFVRLIEGDIMVDKSGEIFSDIPGTIVATPGAMKDLWLTFARV